MELMNREMKIIQPSGILDYALAKQLSHEVDELITDGTRVILLDLESVSFIDSSGLGGLVNAFKSARVAGGRLALCSISEQTRMLLEITGMDQVFEIFSSQSEFRRSLLETAQQ